MICNMFGVPVDMNNQEQVMSEFQILSTMPELHMTNRGVIVDSDASINGLSLASNTELEEQFTRSSLQDNLSSFLISAPPIHAFNAYSDALDLSFASPMNCGYDEVVGNVMDPNGWSKFSNKLSLSLATSQSDHRASMSCSAVTKELSLSFASQKPPQFSQEPQYLEIIQEILTQIASYSLENSNQMSYYTSDDDRGMFLSSEADGRFENRSVETKKTELLSLLQAVDHRYSQCMDEIHTVVSAFHAVTSLDPQKHCCFALGTVSCLYKSLRERISNRILSLGKDRSLEPCVMQKQWALQQQKRKEHLWRPQRGLPEKSVAVLRAWMFQNFLHPYPKDSEKHLLAVRSGLSRNQVSNWFINARVRLWKPMIEEMYSEMKGRYEDGSNNVRRRSQRGTSSVK